MYIILKQKILTYIRSLVKLLTIILVGFLFIFIILFIKYKPVYEVTVAGEKIGYINNLNEFKSEVEEQIINKDEKNVAYTSFINEPKYEPKLITRTSDVNNNEEILDELKQNNIVTTYKYYEVSLNDETKAYVDTLDDATKIVDEIKEEFDTENLELNLKINEEYTQDIAKINTDSFQKASITVENAVEEIKEENEAIAVINNVKLSVLPVSGRISSRYGESSSRRRSTHTGLDIACSMGTDIKVVSKGTITFAGRAGSYGNLVKVDHGNGIETWYGHCSKIYSNVGDEVKAGDVIAAVGSTGNSTGPHLHFEIRINGATVNPQKYVY